MRRVVLSSIVLAAGCATNPVTGERELAFVGEDEEIALGKQSAEQVERQIGLYQDAKLEQYVRSVAQPMAEASERPGLPWRFHVLDDPSVNAFALPGGPVYVTRGLLAAMSSGAELATVLGHEIGHITARHSVNQLSKQTLLQLGLGVGSIVSENVARWEPVLGAGVSVLLLKYSRDAEREADELGFRYALAQGWDVRQMADLFQTLQRASEAGGGGALPDWLSTHPNPEDRLEWVRRQRIDRDPSTLETDRERYLTQLDGLVYGPDPRDGFFRGDTFYQPNLALKFEVPRGWTTQDTPAAAAAVSPNQDAAIALASGGEGTPEQALQRFLRENQVEGRPVSEDLVPEAPSVSATFTAQVEGSNVAGIVSFFEWEGKTLQVLGWTGASTLGSYEQAFLASMRSVSRITDERILKLEPARLDVVRLERKTPVAELSRRSTVDAETLARLNAVESGGSVGPGLVKVVVGGDPELLRPERPRADR